MHNSFPKHRVLFRVVCSSIDEALNACHHKEYETEFWNQIHRTREALELETRASPTYSNSARVLIENIEEQAVYFRNEPCAEFRATLNLEDVFNSQFP